MKKLLTGFFAMVTMCSLCAQVTVTPGGSMEFVLKKQPLYHSFANEDGYHFVIKSYENGFPVHHLVSSDKNGNIARTSQMKVDVGVFNNSFSVVGVYPLGNNLYAAVENPDKSSSLNRIFLRPVENGKVMTKSTEIGSMEFQKLMNQGNWFVAATPDKKHLAIVGQMPRDKDEPNQYKYFFVDENLQVVKKGSLTIPDDRKRVHFNHFTASNSGELYLIENRIDKQYTYPNVYRINVNDGKGSVVEVQPEDASQKIMSYAYSFDEAGNLVFAGFYKKKAGMVVGDELARGTFFLNMQDGKMKLNELEKPMPLMMARGLLKNKDTWFIVGEYYKFDKEMTTRSTQPFEENYNYKHNDLLVVALDESGARKFEIPLSRSYTARNFDTDLYPAFGILNGKLAVVYNDQYGKYFPNASSYANYKLPVLVYFNNDGLMEQPVHFAKELQVTNSPYILYPQLFVSSPNGLYVLGGNSSSVRGYLFK